MKYFVTLRLNCPEFCCRTNVRCVGEFMEDEDVFYLLTYMDTTTVEEWIDALKLVKATGNKIFNSDLEEVSVTDLALLLQENSVVKQRRTEQPPQPLSTHRTQ